MVYNIYYDTLNKELKKAIYSKSISSEDLKSIYKNIRLKNQKKKKTINITMILVFFMFFIMSIPIFLNANDSGMIKFFILLFIPLFAIIYGVVYFTQCGILKLQFNKAIKDNYPELYNELKL
ncbi:MAG: hypothetical protein J6D28_05750 [Bacilli bacterium]|nr:hypothetical protein [Bacilli bacterium]